MRNGILLALVLAAGGLAAAAAVAAEVSGPSSSQSPYVIGSQPGVQIRSILTVGDGVGGYRLAGLPDGLGAFDNGDGTFTVLVNHELGSTVGAVRAHGAKGAFVSKWTIRKDDLGVVSGQDLIQNVATWNSVTSSYNSPAQGVALGRLCSADLPDESAFWNEASGLGSDGRLFLDGEEVAGGRAFAHALDGTSWELPRLGKFSWENSVASPTGGNKTIVVGLDDTSPVGEVYVYIGNKTSSGSAVEKAGLTNGALFGVKVTGYPAEAIATGIPSGTPFSLHPLGNVEHTSGAQLQTATTAGAVTQFRRPEDGAWDMKNPNAFYFVTTASFNEASRLWRLTFADVSNPAAGGTLDLLLEGTEDGGTSERFHMLDNLGLDSRGRVLLQEDPGNQAYLARIWQYDPSSDTLTEIAHHDPNRFAPGAPGQLTVDEESSGIIDVSEILGEGWFLADVQAHYPTDAELVEGGQLLALHVPPGKFPKNRGK